MLCMCVCVYGVLCVCNYVMYVVYAMYVVGMFMYVRAFESFFSAKSITVMCNII